MKTPKNKSNKKLNNQASQPVFGNPQIKKIMKDPKRRASIEAKRTACI